MNPITNFITTDHIATMLMHDFTDDAIDPYELLDTIDDFSTRIAFALAIDACPIHLCDHEICLDDDATPCAALYRSARESLIDDDDFTNLMMHFLIAESDPH